MTVQDILEIIDKNTEPSAMTWRQAVEFLEQLREEIKERIWALTDEGV